MVDPFGLCGEEANDQGQKSKYQWLHNALDWAGLVFDGADIVNGILYAAEGDYVNAAISFACGIPAVGTVIAGMAKMSKAAKAMKTADRIADLCKAAGKVGNTAAGMKANYDTYMQARREGKSVGEAMTYTAGAMVAGLAMGKAANWGANKLKNLADKALPKLKTAVQEGAGKLASKISKGFSSSGSGRMNRNRGFVVNPFYKGGSGSIKYSPINPCDEISREVAESFSGASFTKKILSEDTVMYRVSGGTAGEVGSYLSRTPQGGGLQSQLDLALNPAWGNTTENITKVVVPKGTSIYEGIAAPQNIYDSLNNVIGTLPGGGNQVYIPKVEARWFK